MFLTSAVLASPFAMNLEQMEWTHWLSISSHLSLPSYKHLTFVHIYTSHNCIQRKLAPSPALGMVFITFSILAHDIP